MRFAPVRGALVLSAVLLAGFVPASQNATASSPPRTLFIGLDSQVGAEATALHEIGRTPALINAFFGFQNGSNPEAFPTQFVQSVIADGSTPMVTWQPILSTYRTKSVLSTISEGGLDGYIMSWAQSARAVHHRIYVRLMHEMNGDWYPWGAVTAGHTPLPGGGTYPYSNTPAMYTAAFRHVVGIFDAAGATNVEFVWCASSAVQVGQLSQYYPGDDDVRWASLDGYNKSATEPRTALQLFGPAYASITSFSSRPILIAETASVEYSSASLTPPSKAAWILDTFLTEIPSDFPRVEGVDYYDAPGLADSNFAIDSSPATLAAIRQVYASSTYRDVAP